ncbi:TonB-dependent receptor [Chitinophaga sp.]|uniref:SusC/RagA family TonB-linked outer membrane protein n=1 Tax=Chitinophaga sp. TaxID=1869181 RepID=UPI0031D60AD4
MKSTALLHSALLLAVAAVTSGRALAGPLLDVAAGDRVQRAKQDVSVAWQQQKTLLQLLKEIHKTYKIDLLYEAKNLPKVKVDFTPSEYDNVEDMLKALLTPYGLQAQAVQPNTWAIVPLREEPNGKPRPAAPGKQQAAEDVQQNPSLLKLQGAANMAVHGSAPDTVKRVRISGRITDSENALPLPGVAVMVKGDMRGAQTDADGKYTVDAVPGKVLAFNLLGYESREVTVSAQRNIDLALDVSNRALNEVVVVGYGSVRKSLVTGAISSVKGTDLATVSAGRVEQALQGRAAGIIILPVSGSPGSGMRVRIRGTGSNGSSEPLYIIDGMRAGNMEYLDPSEIASVEVLKDAASAAIYGAEGANGVVIITTRSGQRDATPRVEYSMQYARQSIHKPMKMMNAAQYARYLTDAGTSGSLPDPAAWAGKQGTMWMDEITQNAPMQRHSLNFSSGTEKSTYLLGASMFHQNGVIGGEKARFDRYTLRLNTDHQVKPWLSVGNRLSYAYFKRNGVSEDSEFGAVINSAIMMDPTMPIVYTGALSPRAQKALDDGYTLVKDADGRYYGISDYVFGEAGNPLAQIDITHNTTTQHKITGNVYAEAQPLASLKITTRFGIDAMFLRSHAWMPSFYFNASRLNTSPGTFDNNENWNNWQWENFATYSRKINYHDLSIMAGMSALRRNYNRLNGSAYGMFKEEKNFGYPDFLPDGEDRIGGVQTSTSMISYFGRLQYNYKDKYLLNATLRRDGSSLLPPQNTWGTFPSVSAGWIATNEAFFPDLPLNYLKLRASWGQNGSIANINIGDWQALITSQSISYPDANGDFHTGAEPAGLENPYLKWEASEQLDLGADMGFFDNRLSVTVDYYNKTTKGLLTPGTVPSFVGNVLATVNGGDVRNRGWEFELAYRSNSARAFTFEVSMNLTTIHNEVIRLNEFVDRLPGSNVGTGWRATWFEKGYPIWYFRGYKTAGIFQDQKEVDDYTARIKMTVPPKPGDPIIVDTDGDGTISNSDHAFIGSPHPNVVYGANLRMAYKGVDLVVLVQGQAGNDVLMGFNRVDRPTANRPEFFYKDRWTGEGSTNKWFAANTNSEFVYNSDMMLFDGSYMRVRQLQLGYTLPERVIKRIRFRNARIYGSLDNFFTLTKYKGMDPEAGSNDVNSLGVDRGVYPIPRSAVVGLTFSF